MTLSSLLQSASQYVILGMLIFHMSRSTYAFLVDWVPWTVLADKALFFLTLASANRLRDAGHRDRRFHLMFCIGLVGLLLRGLFLPLHRLDTWWGTMACSALFTAIVNWCIMAWRLSHVGEHSWTFDAFRRRHATTLLIGAAACAIRGWIYALYFEMNVIGWMYLGSKCLKSISMLSEACAQWFQQEYGDSRVVEDGALDPCPVCLENVRGRIVTLAGCNHSYCDNCLANMRFSLQYPLACPMCRRDAQLPPFMDEIDSIVPSALFRLF